MCLNGYQLFRMVSKCFDIVCELFIDFLKWLWRPESHDEDNTTKHHYQEQKPTQTPKYKKRSHELNTTNKSMRTTIHVLFSSDLFALTSLSAGFFKQTWGIYDFHFCINSCGQLHISNGKIRNTDFFAIQTNSHVFVCAPNCLL